jgi:fucose 4-O-acetylase-like acetyltransferase
MNSIFRQRDIYVDVAKCIAMLLVVRIHTEVFDTIRAPYPLIAVPLFFFLSGFYDNTDKPLKEWLPKTFKRLFLVGVIWVLISFAYVSLLHYLKDHTFEIHCTWQKPLIGGGATWFLFALFHAKCLVWIINKIKIPDYIILLLMILFGGVISRIDLPLLLDEGFAAIPFYYAGKVCYPLINRHWKIICWLAVIGMVCIMLMPMKWFPNVLISYGQRSFYMYPVYFLMTISSFASVIWLSKKLENQKWLANYGKQTLGILVLHPLMLHTCAIILNRVLVKGSVPWIITFVGCYIIVCILCYYCSRWISKHFPVLLGAK